MPNLLEDLTAAQRAAEGERPCALCDYIRAVPDAPTQNALRDAAGGTLSVRALERIMTKHQTGVGRRTIDRHRGEEHKP